MSDGWIKLWRKLTDSSMYKNLNSVQRDVLIQCLLFANHKPNEWEWGKEIHRCEPGQFITSLESIRSKCAKGTSIKNVRTALLKLEKWEFLANESANTGRKITILNWDVYQNTEEDTGKDTGKEGAKSRQRGGKEPATNNNDKKDNNDNKEKNTQYMEFEKKFITGWKNLSAQCGLADVRSFTKNRKAKLRTRYQEDDFRENIKEIFKNISQSNFLLGDNNNGWKITVDWLIKNDNNYHKVLEGVYNRSPKRTNNNQNDIINYFKEQENEEERGSGDISFSL